jgi:hypothetical protein
VEKRKKKASNRQIRGESRTEYPVQERRDFDGREVKAILEGYGWPSKTDNVDLQDWSEGRGVL